MRYVDQTDTCWLWTGQATPTGYGRVSVGSKQQPAHRVAYKLAKGAIPAGMNIDHICHTTLCVNPAHLRLATTKENAENRAGADRDSLSGVRGVTPSATPGKWIVRIGHNGKTLHIGTFNSLDEANAAAIAKRNELFTHNADDRAA